MAVSVALFTADLRVHDNPVLHGALAGGDAVVPLFVLDDAVHAAGFDVPNRRAFLADCLASLDAALRARGGRLVLRHGRVAEEVRAVVRRCGAREVHVAAGCSGYAQRREAALRRALRGLPCALRVHEGSQTAVVPGAVTPQGRDHYAVFTPYFRRWREVPPRSPLAAPRTVRVPSGLSSRPLPSRSAAGDVSPRLPRGGEEAARRRAAAWLRDGLPGYADGQDDLAADRTSRLSPHLHFGTVSAAELVHRARRAGGPGADAFVRQLAWRDFHHQVLAARPRTAREDYRTHGDTWRADAREVAAWRAGRTGYPLVDAAMRQLRAEGWMHNRARLVAASFLTKSLYADWRVGARHFLDLLVDGDVANNQLNWQWVAGTGTDTRPNRVLNPVAQARRLDPDGAYVRRWLPELADLPGRTALRPWTLPAKRRAAVDYPEPLLPPDALGERLRRARGLD